MRDLNVEARSYVSHDPFADENSGPKPSAARALSSNPHGFAESAQHAATRGDVPQRWEHQFARGPHRCGTFRIVSSSHRSRTARYHTVPWTTSPNVVPLRYAFGVLTVLVGLFSQRR